MASCIVRYIVFMSVHPIQERIVKLMMATVGLATLALASPVWAQGGGAAQSGTNDPIVQMRMEVDAANKAYNKKVNAAKKVYDHKKAEAAKERDAAIAAAHHGASSQ